MKDKMKITIIIVTIIILIFMLFGIVSLIKKNNNVKTSNLNNFSNNNESNIDNEDEAQEVNMEELNAEEINDDSEFLTVQNILSKILTAINSKNTKELKGYFNPNAENITENNILNLFNNDDFSYWYLLSMQKKNVSNTITEFTLNISDAKAIKNQNYNENTDAINFNIYLDSNNKTFYFTINSPDSIDNIQSITKNSYNKFNYIKATDEMLGKYYLSLFKYLTQKNPSLAFQILSIDETNSISTYEDFQSYIKNTNIDTEKIIVTKTTENQATILQIVDSNNNHFKFKLYTYTNFIVNLDNSDVKTEQQKFANVLSINKSNVSNDEITNFLNNFINLSVNSINTETKGLSDNKIRKYYEEHKNQINDMGIYNEEDLVNLSNQIVGIRWSKGATFMRSAVNGVTEQEGYLRYNLKLSYTMNSEINLYLCLAKSDEVTPKIKIETTGVKNNDEDTYTD